MVIEEYFGHWMSKKGSIGQAMGLLAKALFNVGCGYMDIPILYKAKAKAKA